MRLFATLLTLGFTAAQEMAPDLSAIVQVHSSGGTNPGQCYWHILEQLQVQAKIPIRMSFRAVGSGQGQREFMGENITQPFNHFASGEKPMPSDMYNTLKDEGIEMIQLPVLLGAVSFFHSVPLMPGTELNMTSCLIARVFKREITSWNHPDIEAINPYMDIPIKRDSYGNIDPDQSFPIVVNHRAPGSGSTLAITDYIWQTCPEEWSEDLVGSTIEWPEDTKTCTSVSQMVDCIREDAGGIGYVDSGMAHGEGLPEIALSMDANFREGQFYLTSKNSINKGGLLPVLESQSANIPDSADADWGDVNLINKVDGYIYTWPIVVLTYLFVRKDLPSFIPDPRAQTLLITFLKSMYNDEYTEICADRYEFTTIDGPMKELALEGIDMLITSPEAPEWVFESGTVMKEGGQGDYVISSRRKSAAVFEQENLITGMEEIRTQLAEVETNVEGLLAANMSHMDGADGVSEVSDSSFGDQEEQFLKVAFILSILSLCLWSVTIVAFCSLRSQMKELASRKSVALEAAPKVSKKKRQTA